MHANRPRLVILPDADRVEAHLQEIARRRGIADAAWVWTLPRLEAACAEAAPGNRRQVSPIEARWVVGEVARTLRPAVFGASVEQAAFARQAHAVFEELEAGGVTPAQVSAAIPELEALTAERLRGLVALWDAWRQRMAALNWLGRSQQLVLATGVLEQTGLPDPLRGLGALQLRSIYDFPPQREAFVVALGKACARAGVRFEVEVPGAGNPLVDAAVDPILRRLEGAHAELGTTEAQKALPDPSAFPWSALGTWLFQRPPSAGVAQELAEGVTVWSAATPKAELDQLVREVVRKLREGTPPERIAIAYRNLGTEAEALAARFSALGVPVRVRVGAPLGHTALGRMALELPLLVDEDFPADGMARLLGLMEEGRVGQRAPSVVFREAGVRNDRRGAASGQGAFTVRLEQHARRLEGRGSDADDVRELAARCQQLIRSLQAIPAEATAMELFESWWKVVETLGLAVERPGRTRRPGDALTDLERMLATSEARDHAAGGALRQLAARVRSSLRETGMGMARMHRRTFSRWLADAASELRVEGAGGSGPAAVEILELRELVGRDFDLVAIAGLTEGRLPGRGNPEPLLDERERQRLNRALGAQVFRLWSGEEEGLAPWRMAEDRLLFFLALASARESLSLGFARQDASGREQEMSTFLGDLTSLMSLTVRRLPARVVPDIGEAQTPDAIRERVALELYADPLLRTGEVAPPPRGLSEALGDAAWLQEAARVSEMETERLRAFVSNGARVGPYSGGIEGDGLSTVLAQRFAFGDERPLSATALEALAGCRYRGFLRIALGLREPDEAGEDVDPRGEGVLHHRVLELLFARLGERGLLGASADELPEGLLEEVVDRAIADVSERAHTGHPALWALGRGRALRMVRRVLGHTTRGRPFEGLDPADAERRFGTPEAEDAWRRVQLQTGDPDAPVHLTGTIDRIDGVGGTVALVDYKNSTRSASEYAKRLLKQDFQLPLYLLAARAAGHSGAVNAAWISLKDGAPVLLSEVLGKAEVDPELLLATDDVQRARAREQDHPNVVNAVSELVQQAREGRFPIASEDCGYCPYRAVCRITERRTSEEEQ